MWGPPLHHLIAMDFQVFLVLSASQNLVLVDKIEDQRIKEVCQDTKTAWILILKDHMESIISWYKLHEYVCKNQKNIIYVTYWLYYMTHTGHYMIYIYVIKYHLNSFKYDSLILILRPVPPINTTTGQPGFFPPPFQYIPSWSKPAA